MAGHVFGNLPYAIGLIQHGFRAVGETTERLEYQAGHDSRRYRLSELGHVEQKVKILGFPI